MKRTILKLKFNNFFQDFVYQAALRDGGPQAAGHIFRGILRSLTKALAPPPSCRQSAGPLLASYSGAKYSHLKEAESNGVLTQPAGLMVKKRRQRQQAGRTGDSWSNCQQDQEAGEVKR
jgi:hypothetical protein